LDEQDAEENFDLALIEALELAVVPHLGDKRLPDSLVSQLGKILLQGSRLYHQPNASDGLKSTSPTTATSVKINSGIKHRPGDPHIQGEASAESVYDAGSTDSGSPIPRERFSYWCFDLFFLICSGGTSAIPSSNFSLSRT